MDQRMNDGCMDQGMNSHTKVFFLFGARVRERVHFALCVFVHFERILCVFVHFERIWVL